MARLIISTDRATGASQTLAALLVSLCVIGTSAHAQSASSAEPAVSAEPLVVLEADSLHRDEEKQLIIAEGRVEARYGGRLLRAEQLIYDLQKKTVRAKGGVELIEADGSVRFADEVEVDSALNAGVATGFSVRLEGGGTLAAGSAIRNEDGSAELGRMVYTACPICDDGEGSPTWTLKARRARQDTKNNLIVYRDAVLRLKGIPVVYLPYFAHPDPSAERQSGLLPPEIGRNTRTGWFVTQPYLWTVDPYTDFTIAPQAFVRVNPLLKLDLRRRFYSGSAEFSGSIGYDRDFDNTGARFGNRTVRGHVFGTGDFRIDENWRWGFSLARTTDDLYLRRYGIAGAETRRGIYSGDITRLYSQINLVGQDSNSYSEVSAISVQGLRFDDTSDTTPAALPIGETEHVFRDPLLDGQFRLQASTAVVARGGDGIDSTRISAGFSYALNRKIGPGILVQPFAQGRGDAYRIAGGSGDPDTLIRSNGVVGAEVRWPLIRPGNRVDVLIEPIAMAAYASSDGNDPRIPNEDSIRFELDESALFRANAAPNADVFEPGPRASFGLRAAATTQLGSISAVAGRRWRSQLRPELFGALTNLDETLSDWVGGVDADLGPNFGGNVRFRLDNNLNIQRIDASARAKIWRLTTAARYFAVDEALSGLGPNSEISGTADVRLTRHWSAGYTVRRDLERNTNLSQGARLRYSDDCTFLEFSYDRDQIFDRTLGPATTFSVRIGLSTLGILGTNNRRDNF